MVSPALQFGAVLRFVADPRQVFHNASQKGIYEFQATDAFMREEQAAGNDAVIGPLYDLAEDAPDKRTVYAFTQGDARTYRQLEDERRLSAALARYLQNHPDTLKHRADVTNLNAETISRHSTLLQGLKEKIETRIIDHHWFRAFFDRR